MAQELAHDWKSEARAHARTILGAVAAGQDPAKERSQANSGMPIAQLVELFVSEHAKPKRKSQTGPSYLKKPWRAIQRHAGLEGVRIHDLRHTFASIGAGASLGLPIVGKLLGHSQPATTARYAHLDADPLRRAANAIGNQIAGALGLIQKITTI